MQQAISLNEMRDSARDINLGIITPPRCWTASPTRGFNLGFKSRSGSKSEHKKYGDYLLPNSRKIGEMK